ncbi:hypothetical protein BV22DRAFT_1199569 [Leucogyrophana mollusca]|uniref:Uncharacterized protein n=1 Tax=Leucogyrophana mollusca TaxID=85980 RepID=A0ACB8B290_9AGAM|nr:hypothetical protein BV22DRAFT_1199569 [Leucogyrophana mollusca]
MASTSIDPLDVPPYLVEPLIPSITVGKVTCAQALGSEIYVGCSNGELLRYAMQADDSSKLESYSLLSRQSLPNEKAINEIVLVPYLSRALILCDHQIHFYTLPSLDPVPNVKPIRNVVTFAVDQQHLQRPAPSFAEPSTKLSPVEFCVIKRSSIALYSLQDRLFYQKEIPFQQGATLARRTGRYLCVADREFYNMIDLQSASMFQLLPLSQAFDNPAPVKPFITVISENEFLLLSWTGATTLGVFITGEGDPVRGTLEWPSHPEALCLDYPYITTLLPNGTIEIHSVETQAIIQVVSAPANMEDRERVTLVACMGGYMVSSSQRSDKMRMKKVKLVRRAQATPSSDGSSNSDSQGNEGSAEDIVATDT